MKIIKLTIQTFAGKKYRFTSNINTSVHWGTSHYWLTRKCFMMTIPVDIVKEAISFIILVTESRFLTITVHQDGLYHSDMSGSSVPFYFKDLMEVNVRHEVLNLLEYDKAPCNDDEKYKYDQCRQSFIFRQDVKVCCYEVIDWWKVQWFSVVWHIWPS